MTWTSLLLAAAALACGGSNRGTVAVSVKAAATTPSSTGGADLGSGIVLSEVRMVVRRITLFQAPQAQDPAPTSTGMDAEVPGADDRDEEPSSSFGPFPVDVVADKLSGGIHPAFDAQVDKGTYAGARIAVNTLRSEAQTTDPVLSALQGLHASIVVDGTIDGQTFRFVTPMRVAQWKAGPIVVGDATTNLTLDVDPRGWFKAADGTTRLDPRLDTDRGQILANIRCSIRLFEDDDRDGEPDDGHHEGPEGCPATPPAM